MFVTTITIRMFGINLGTSERIISTFARLEPRNEVVYTESRPRITSDGGTQSTISAQKGVFHDPRISVHRGRLHHDVRKNLKSQRRNEILRSRLRDPALLLGHMRAKLMVCQSDRNRPKERLVALGSRKRTFLATLSPYRPRERYFGRPFPAFDHNPGSCNPWALCPRVVQE